MRTCVIIIIAFTIVINFVIKHIMVYLSGVASDFILTAPFVTRNAYKITVGKLGRLSNSKYLCLDETQNLISVNK